MHYPPTLSLVNLVVRAASAATAMRDATQLARALRLGRPPFEVLGPAAAPLPRLRGDLPRPGDPQGHEARGDAAGRRSERWRSTPRWLAGPWSTSIP